MITRVAEVLTTSSGDVAAGAGSALLRAAAAVAGSSSLESLSRPFLDVLHSVAGLDSAYLTAVRPDDNEQTVLFSDNRGAITIPEGLTVAWQDTLCYRALDTGRRWTSNVDRDLPGSAGASELGLRTYASVPVNGPDEQLIGTLCAAGTQCRTVAPRVLDIMAMLARLIADQWHRDQIHQAALDRAEAAETRLRERATFLAVAEHKLKSPLFVLRGWSDILVDQWDEVSTQVRGEALRDMSDASHEAVRQLDDLLIEARSEVLSLQLDLVPIPLADEVVRVVRQLQAASTKHDVHAETGGDAVVLADRVALWQVLWHLGENAVKYSPGGGRIDVGIESVDGRTAAVTVRDEGIGVPVDVDVFQPFTRGTSKPMADIAGTGLGLHIVATLVQSMGGTVTAEPRAGRGSLFRVTLPLAT